VLLLLVVVVMSVVVVVVVVVSHLEHAHRARHGRRLLVDLLQCIHCADHRATLRSAVRTGVKV
jgi:hypothetical protein